MELDEALAAARLQLCEGMATSVGRVVATEPAVLVFDGNSVVPAKDARVRLDDRATFLLALEEVARRTGLDASKGLLWYLSEGDDAVWVLEGGDETRMRDGDTDDPILALARALAETAPAG